MRVRGCWACLSNGCCDEDLGPAKDVPTAIRQVFMSAEHQREQLGCSPHYCGRADVFLAGEAEAL